MTQNHLPSGFERTVDPGSPSVERSDGFPAKSLLVFLTLASLSVPFRPAVAQDRQPEPLRAIPSLEIGTVDGPPHLLFHQVAGGALLGDSTIMIADGGSGELRRFSLNGEWLGSVGQTGDGPGEFRRIHSLSARGDSIFVFDDILLRLSIFAPSGRLIGTESYSEVGAPGTFSLYGPFTDDAYLVVRLLGSTQGFDRRLSKEYVSLHRWMPSTIGPGEKVERLFWRQTYHVQRDNVWEAFSVPWSPTGSVAVAGDKIVYSDGMSGRVSLIASSGEEVGRIALPWSGRVVSDRDRDWFESHDLPEHPGIPDRLPSVGAVLAAGDGSIWVGEFAVGHEAVRTWLIRRPAASCDEQLVSLPSRVRVLDSRDELILGVQFGDHDVEFVVLYSVPVPPECRRG
jgi:hypothetical protein